MRFGLVLASLLCLTTWMVHGTHAQMAGCCFRWSSARVPLEGILDYTIRSQGVCAITAVVFQTKRGNRICSDPNSDWTKKAILKVEEEKNKSIVRQGTTSHQQCPPHQETHHTRQKRKETPEKVVQGK